MTHPALTQVPDPTPFPAAASATSQSLKRFVVRTKGRIDLLAVERVDWIEAGRGFVVLHAAGGPFRFHQRLNELESRLDPAVFVRVHRSYIVRTAAVRALESDARGELSVVLGDGTQLAVGRSRHARVRRALLA